MLKGVQGKSQSKEIRPHYFLGGCFESNYSFNTCSLALISALAKADLLHPPLGNWGHPLAIGVSCWPQHCRDVGAWLSSSCECSKEQSIAPEGAAESFQKQSPSPGPHHPLRIFPQNCFWPALIYSCFLPHIWSYQIFLLRLLMRTKGSHFQIVMGSSFFS